MGMLPNYFYFVPKVEWKDGAAVVELEDHSHADVVEVVRCRECRHGLYNENYGNVVCSVHLWTRGPRYFCGDGQRREDGEDGVGHGASS